MLQWLVSFRKYQATSVDYQELDLNARYTWTISRVEFFGGRFGLDYDVEATGYSGWY